MSLNRFQSKYLEAAYADHVLYLGDEGRAIAWFRRERKRVLRAQRRLRRETRGWA